MDKWEAVSAYSLSSKSIWGNANGHPDGASDKALNQLLEDGWEPIGADAKQVLGMTLWHLRRLVPESATEAPKPKGKPYVMHA